MKKNEIIPFPNGAKWNEIYLLYIPFPILFVVKSDDLCLPNNSGEAYSVAKKVTDLAMLLETNGPRKSRSRKSCKKEQVDIEVQWVA